MSLSKLSEKPRGSTPRFCRQLLDGMQHNRPLSLLTLVTFSAIISFMAARTQAGFITAPTYPAGSNPSAIVVADFNGDGIPDLAVANTSTSSSPGSGVTILLGQGDGSFQAVHSYSIDSAAALAVADFDGDGHLDLAVTNYGSGMISILNGNGDGSFQPAQPYPAGPYPAAAAVGDFNNDGILDLAVVNDNNSQTISMLLGNGDGSFQPPMGSYAAGASPGSIVAGDFNGDGFLDLAVVNQVLNRGSVSILLGNGDGTFQATQAYRVATNPYSLAIGDFNGDGILDLATASYLSGTVTILLGNGDGSFRNAGDYPAGPSLPSYVVAGDLNGDGYPDLAVASADSGTVSILLGNGDGTFQTPTQAYAAAARPRALAVADFNHDGHPDIALANAGDDVLSYENGSVSILIGKGDGTFPQAARSYFNGSFSGAVGDFNGDGILDVVAFNYPGTLSVLLGRGDGTFQDGLVMPAGDGTTSVAVGDLNGDGKLDIVTTNFSFTYNIRLGLLTVIESDVRVFLGNGDGTFQPAGIYNTGVGPSAVAVADLNGDGIPDLAVADGGDGGTLAPGNTLSILLGNGDGTFQPAVIYSVGYVPWTVAVGDFNSDGIPDLAVAGADANQHAKLSIMLGKGNGTFQAAKDYNAGSGAFAMATGDFNADGIPDLVIVGYTDDYYVGIVSIWLGNGDGTFQAPRTYAAGSIPSSVVAADFNGDTIPDLAVASSGLSSVAILLGTGDGAFGPAQSFPIGASSGTIAAADFNGDGFPDLALGGQMKVLLNDADWRR